MACFTVQVSDLKREMPDLKLEAPDLTSEMPDLKPEVPDLISEARDLTLEMPDLKAEVPDLKSEVPDLKSEVLGIRHGWIRLHVTTVTVCNTQLIITLCVYRALLLKAYDTPLQRRLIKLHVIAWIPSPLSSCLGEGYMYQFLPLLSVMKAF